MRWLLGGIVCVLASALILQAQDGARLSKFSLGPITTPPGAGKLQASQIELLNSTLEEFASAYGRFSEGRRNLRELLEANERVIAASRDAFSTSTERVNFASKHLSLAKAIEEETSSRDGDDQDARFAKQIRLAAEIQMLRITETPVAPVPGVAPAPAVGPVRVPMPRIEVKSPALSPGELKPADEKALEKVDARLLDIRSTAGMHQFFLSDDGKHAIVVEGKREEPRYALWNFDKGKMLRYLSADEGKETKEYKGDDEADHGAATIFALRQPLKFVVSPDGKWIAGLTRITPPPPAVDEPPALPAPRKIMEEILVWELASGRLARTIITTHHHPYTFFFVDDSHIAAKAFSKEGVSIERMDVETGEVDYLMSPDNFEMYGNGLHKGIVAFVKPDGAPVTVQLDTKEQTSFDPPPAGSSRMAAERTWFSQDGKELFLKKSGVVEVWDVETKSYRHEWRLADDNRSFDLVGVAPTANLIARRLTKEKKLELIDVAQGKVVSSLAGLTRPGLAGLSHDAKRLALSISDQKMLVIDFADGIPAGEMAFQALEKKAGGEASR